MASVAGPDERIEEARRRWRDAADAATRACDELGRLEIEAATARARAKLEAALSQGALSPELHGEIVVDAARDHGAVSARAGAISDVSWRGVRVAVASLVARTRAAESGLAVLSARTLAAMQCTCGASDCPAVAEVRKAIADVADAAKAYEESVRQDDRRHRPRRRVTVELDLEQDLLSVIPQDVPIQPLELTAGDGDAEGARKFFGEVSHFLEALGIEVTMRARDAERDADEGSDP